MEVVKAIYSHVEALNKQLPPVSLHFSVKHTEKSLPMAFAILTEELKNVNWQLNGPFLSVNVQRDFITATANTCLYHHEPLVLVSYSQIRRGPDVSCIC